MATNFQTMTSPAPRFPVALSLSIAFGRRKSTIKAKKIGTLPGMMVRSDPQTLL